MPLLKIVSPNWAAPIAVPGFGVYFPDMGLANIPEPAIAWLESIGFVTTAEPIEETKQEDNSPKKKRSVKVEPADPTPAED